MTFSIIGFDPLKNRFGVAVSSCHIAVGSTVSFVRSQVGAVATQGQTNPYLGLRSLESLQSCSDSKIVLEDLIKEGFFKNIRNTNYLGEILIYLSFAILSMSFIPLVILAIFFSIVFLPRMIKKDKSLSKYDSFEEYKKKSGLILPKLNA